MKGYYLMPHPPLIIPQIGRGEEKKIESTIKACTEIGRRIRETAPDTVIIITPHGMVFRDAVAVYTQEEISGDLGRFGAPGISMSLETDTELADLIIENAEKDGLVAVRIGSGAGNQYEDRAQLDHGVMVPLYFTGDMKFRIVCLAYGFLTPRELYRFGMAIEKSVKETGRSAVMIASGDLSHHLTDDGPYKYSPYGPKFDKRITEIISSGDIEDIFYMDEKETREAGECGLRSLYMLAGALDGKTAEGELLSYEGPFGVGYAVAEFHFGDEAEIQDLMTESVSRHVRRMKEGSSHTRLARVSLDYFFRNHVPMPLKKSDWPELFSKRGGAFVSIKIGRNLRGCIGTIMPTTGSLAEEIVQNAISAAVEDPRFMPMDMEELRECDISVDVLGSPQRCSREDLDPKRYGVIVSRGSRKGLLLPELEGVDTSGQQLAIALRKAGIPEDADYEIERFEVVRYEEETK